MYQYKPVLYYVPLISQLPTLVDPPIDWAKISEVAIVAIALVLVARAFLLFVKNVGENDARETGLLKQMIDLATSYKTESTEAREAYRQEAAATRAVVQESNSEQRATRETLTKVIEATHEQTGELRLLRFDFKERQSVYADEIESFKNVIELLRGEMVVFKGEIKTEIEQMLTSEGATRERVDHAVNNHDLIFAKLDNIIALFPQPTIQADNPPTLSDDELKPTGTG